MILWMVKLISSVRRAVAGRKYPSQLAWAVSFGLLLGVVPHGNLLAVAILIVVLSLRINHAMAGLTAIAASFAAARLDPYSHQVGEFVLSHPQVNEKAIAAWQLPMMPWTDLNNTVVMGSLLIGLAALVPVFLVTYPVFRLLAPRKASQDASGAEKAPADVRKQEGVHQVVLVDPGHQTVMAPHHRPAVEREASDEEVDFVEIDHSATNEQQMVAVETRIDVIRMQDHRDVDNTDPSSTDASEDQAQPMDEALNYLLRQLRDSQEGKAA